MKKLLLAMLVVVVFLVACSDSDASKEQAAQVDVNNLPDTVDVQTVADIKDMDNVFVLDVREQWEYDEGHIPGVTLIPMDQISSRLDEIPTDQEVIVTCRTGNRSEQVTEFLREQGFDNVHNMEGGIVAWEEADLPVER